jgi:hypothetical protein
MPQLLYLWERALVPIVQEAGWALEPVQMGEESLTHTMVWTPQRVES